MSHLSSQLEPGHFAYIIDNGRDGNNVRTQPLVADTTFIGAAPVGSVMFISAHASLGTYDNPYRGDPKRTWWHVIARGKEQGGKVPVLTGWTAAAENGVDFLARLQPLEGCEVPSMFHRKQDTYLKAGTRAFVATPGDTLAVRPTPSTKKDRIKRLQPGTIVTVIGQPTCEEDVRTWWQIAPDQWVCENEWQTGYLDWYLIPLHR